MRKLVLIFLLFINLYSYSQIKFEKGYFINNNGKQTNCLIKNIDWKNNPKNFKYKLSEDTPTIDANVNFIKEFAINNEVKYRRFLVKIDRSSDELHNMTKNRNSEWNEETLFLKILVEGNTTLFSYEEGNLKKFFFSNNDSISQQLIHKYYLLSNGNKATNNDFRQQLKDLVNCQKLSANAFKRINYKQNDLITHFTKSNTCDSSNVNYVKKQKTKDLFNFKIKPGINFSSLTIKNLITTSGLRDTDFGSKTALKLGIEVEYIFPFNKNKWGIFIEPTYQSFKATKETDINLTLTVITHQTAVVDFKSIEVPIGIRHYFFLNDTSTLFLNANYVFDFDINSSIKFEVGSNLEVESSNFFAMGLGYGFNNKFSMEFRYNFNRNILNESWSSDYNSASIILGYRFF